MAAPTGTRSAPPRPSPARELLREGLEEAREAAARPIEALRRADRFTRSRVAIVGAWALLSLVTLWATCSSPGAGNALGADVQVNRGTIMGAQLLVRNDSSDIWEDVLLTLDGGWLYSQPTMRPHDLVVVSLGSFRKGEDAPPHDFRPRSLTITCSRGSHRFELR